MMPRYHFNITDGDRFATDIDGTEHEDDETARAEALIGARYLMAESDGIGLCRRHWMMVVTNGHGQRLLTVPFCDALQPDRLTSSDIGSILARAPP